MSGIVGSKLNIRGSGRIAKLGTDGQVLTSSGAGVQANYEDAAGGGLDWQAIETGSTMTAVAGNGYWINTTSNACTITLPSSASNGDEIMFADYARTWGTYSINLDSNGLNYQGQDDTYAVEYGTDGQSVHIVYSGATKGWIPTLDKTVEDAPSLGNSEGIFLWGDSGGTNLISNTGVVSADTSTPAGAVAKQLAGATQYGGDKGIVAFGNSYVDESNLITNAGVVGADVTGVGTDRSTLAACSFGGDKGIIAFGTTGSNTGVSNLVSNAGVVATDVAAVGTARSGLAACEYGTDTAIFAFGIAGAVVDESNLVTNVGVIGSDVTGVGTDRRLMGACSYGFDKGIFAFGYHTSSVNVSNLVTNVGVVGSDVTGVGTSRGYTCACEYDGDKGIFSGGETFSYTAITNLVSNAGVVQTDTAAVAGVTANQGRSACSFN
jgi:hypothetical protein